MWIFYVALGSVLTALAASPASSAQQKPSDDPVNPGHHLRL